MKSTILIPLSFIIFLSSANSTPDSITDFTGKILRPGINYHVMPAARDGSSGGLTLGATGNKSCPLGITQFRRNKYGMPLTFSPVNPNKGVIRLSTDVNIKFTGSNNCNQSSVWKLEYDEDVKQYWVMVGGVEGNPGRETLDNWFKIEKTNDGYKFVFCPTVCNFCKVLCRDVGIVLDGHGMKRLALSDVPFSWIFMR